MDPRQVHGHSLTFALFPCVADVFFFASTAVGVLAGPAAPKEDERR
jgi:hypothetical protein